MPPGELFDWPGRINVFRYGLTEFSDLFTSRQLLALTTFSDLVIAIRERILTDALLGDGQSAIDSKSAVPAPRLMRMPLPLISQCAFRSLLIGARRSSLGFSDVSPLGTHSRAKRYR